MASSRAPSASSRIEWHFDTHVVVADLPARRGHARLLFGGLAAWPFIESWITGDKSEHHLLDRHGTLRRVRPSAWPASPGTRCSGSPAARHPREHVRRKLNAITWPCATPSGCPVIAFIISRRVCMSLQRHDASALLHGAESGVIVRTPDGGYYEDHMPIPLDEAFTLTQHGSTRRSSRRPPSTRTA